MSNTSHLYGDFFSVTAEKRKPTFKERAEIGRLQELSFKRLNTEDDKELFLQILHKAGEMINLKLGEESPRRSIRHPFMWKMLGFSGEDPLVDFERFSTLLVPGNIQKDEVNDRNYSPLAARFTGNRLTLECMAYFFRKHEATMTTIIAARHSAGMESTYAFATVTREIARFLCATFCIIRTKIEEPPKHPIQPCTKAMVPFEVDERERRTVHEGFPLRPFWSYITEADGFKRLFSLGMIVYEREFQKSGTDIRDTYRVLSDTIAYFEEALQTSTLQQLEDKLL